MQFFGMHKKSMFFDAEEQSYYEIVSASKKKCTNCGGSSEKGFSEF